LADLERELDAVVRAAACMIDRLEAGGQGDADGRLAA